MAPPTSASRKLSISIWLTIRARDAPSAKRNAISRVLPEPRTSNKLATLAHAISKTNMTAPNNARIAGRISLTNASRIGFSCTPNWSFDSGYSLARRLAIPSISA